MRGLRLFARAAGGALCLAACTGPGVASRDTVAAAVLNANVSVGFTGHRLLVSPELAAEEAPDTRLTLCLQEIRFDGAAGTPDRIVPFPWGEVGAGREPVPLGDFSVLPGEYRSVTLRMGSECGFSVLVQNSRGRFTSDATIELSWPLSVTIQSRATLVWLPVYPLLSAAGRISDGQQLPSALSTAMDRLERWIEEEDVLQAGFTARLR